MGFRITLKQEFSKEEIESLLSKEKLKLKTRVVLAKREEYKAIHIYFKKDNFSFPWELQIWADKDYNNNINAHNKYKEDYVKWVNE